MLHYLPQINFLKLNLYLKLYKVRLYFLIHNIYINSIQGTTCKNDIDGNNNLFYVLAPNSLSNILKIQSVYFKFSILYGSAKCLI